MERPIQPQNAEPQFLPLSGPTYHAVVLETGQGFKVRPPVTQVNGQTNPYFRLKNNTKYLATVVLPSAIVETADQVTDVASGSAAQVPLRGGGSFSYVVIVHTPGGLVTAQGESDPVIIIDPPCN
ncbi:MAG: hypothetical protein ACM3H9_09805 [Rhodospirillaceae bacterium]